MGLLPLFGLPTDHCSRLTCFLTKNPTGRPEDRPGGAEAPVPPPRTKPATLLPSTSRQAPRRHATRVVPRGRHLGGAGPERPAGHTLPGPVCSPTAGVGSPRVVDLQPPSSPRVLFQGHPLVLGGWPSPLFVLVISDHLHTYVLPASNSIHVSSAFPGPRKQGRLRVSPPHSRSLL